MRMSTRSGWIVLLCIFAACERRPVDPDSLSSEGPEFQSVLTVSGTLRLVSHANVSQISIDTVGLTPDWQTALLAAIEKWNGIENTAASFEIYYGNEGYDVKALHANLQSICGIGDEPVGGQPGDSLKINPSCDWYSSEDKIRLLLHELGHIVGLAHDNSGTRIAGTPSADGASIMINPISAYDFSYYDSVAVQTLYPESPFSVKTYGSLSTVGFEAENPPSGATVVWHWSPDGYSNWSALDSSTCRPGVKATKTYGTAGSPTPIYVRATATVGGVKSTAYLVNPSASYEAASVSVNPNSVHDCTLRKLEVNRPSPSGPWLGTGTVTSSPQGISCTIGWSVNTGTCSFEFPDTTQVTLSASGTYQTPFLEWSGDCSGASCSVLMGTNRIVSPNFECASFGFVYYDGDSYDIDIGDHTGQCWGGAGQNLSWSISGNVGSPSYCTGSLAQCAVGTVIGPCDPDATFSATFYTSSWAYISDYVLDEEIYQPDCS